MSGPIDTLTPFSGGVRLRSLGRHLRDDLEQARRGMLDPRSLVAGYRQQSNPVEVTTTSLVPDSAEVDPRRLATDSRLFTDPIFDGKVWRDLAFDRRRRVVREVRRQHNIQWRAGRDRLMIPSMYGDAGASLNGIVMAYTGSTATTLTGASGLPTATTSAGNAGLQGHVVIAPHATPANTVLGVIMSNTATAPTVDQWYAIPVTGAVGTTPANGAGTAYVLPGGSHWLPWIALSTDATAVAATNAEPAGATFTGEQTANGLARAFVGQGGATAPVITPGTTTSTIALAHTWTYSTSGAVVIAKVLLYNAASATGNLIDFETLLNATGTVSLSGDTLAVTWTHTLTTS